VREPLSKRGAREALKAVSPGLEIVPGRVTRGRRHRTPLEDWEKSQGAICRNCGRETFRIRDGLCYSCWEKENEFEYRGSPEALSFLPRDVIMEIARKPKGEG